MVKALNKEKRNHHVITFMQWVVRASPYAHHVPQTIIVKEGKKDRLVWDRKTKMAPHEITMNEMTDTTNEAKITFGYVYMAFLIWLWNMIITFPIDISSCFRFLLCFADVIGNFGFVIGPWFFAASVMVFGSVSSASLWEPFR